MKREKMVGVLVAVALTVLLIAVGALLVFRMIDGLRRIGEMPSEPVVEMASDAGDAADWSQDALGYAIGDAEDEADWANAEDDWDNADDADDDASAAPTSSPEPMVQVPVIETPEQLAGEG